MAKTVKYGSTNQRGNVTQADYWHASHTFIDNFYRLAPKHKFLYHVAFQINSQVAGGFVEKHGNEIGLLVKYADLPKFDIETQTLQQYNRKKVVQTRLDYSPVILRFHDDNEGVVTRLWQAYYDYYYADTQSPFIVNNVYGPMDASMRYGLDNGSDLPFFYNIEITALSRHTYHTAKLVLPKITGWQHDSVDASAGAEVLESTMQIQYEKVEYSTGKIQEGESPKGFATGEHYDLEPSFSGRSSSNGVQVGSTVNNLDDVFDNTFYTKHEPNYSFTNQDSIDAYQNTKDLSLEGLRPNGLSLTFSEENNKDKVGINGVFFASPANESNVTKATQKISTDRKLDPNFILSRLQIDTQLKHDVVEKYVMLTTQNDFKKMPQSTKDYYIEEFLSNIRNNNPRSIRLASTALNT